MKPKRPYTRLKRCPLCRAKACVLTPLGNCLGVGCSNHQCGCQVLGWVYPVSGAEEERILGRKLGETITNAQANKIQQELRRRTMRDVAKRWNRREQ